MDQNQMNQGGGEAETEANTAPQEEQGVGQEMSSEGDKKPMGPMVGIIIIIIVLILGGLYYWTTQTKEDGSSMTAEEIIAEEDETLMMLEKQSTSDEVADIEADLEMTDLEGLDAELEQIEKELSF